MRHSHTVQRYSDPITDLLVAFFPYSCSGKPGTLLLGDLRHLRVL